MKHALIVTALCIAGVLAVMLWQATPVRQKAEPLYVVTGSLGKCGIVPCGTCEERGLLSGYKYASTRAPLAVGIDSLGDVYSRVEYTPKVECFTNGGNRVDSGGRLDARGDYSLDVRGVPARITAAQEPFMERKR